MSYPKTYYESISCFVESLLCQSNQPFDTLKAHPSFSLLTRLSWARLAKHDVGGITAQLIRHPPNKLYAKGDLFPMHKEVVAALVSGTHALVELPYIARLMLANHHEVNTTLLGRIREGGKTELKRGEGEVREKEC